MDTLLKCPRVRCQPAASRAEVPLLKKAHREVFIRRTLDGVRLTDKVIPTGGISETAANADKCKAVRLTAGCGYSQTNRYYDFTRQEMACLLSARPAGFIDACSSVFVDQTRAGCVRLPLSPVSVAAPTHRPFACIGTRAVLRGLAL